MLNFFGFFYFVFFHRDVTKNNSFGPVLQKKAVFWMSAFTIDLKFYFSFSQKIYLKKNPHKKKELTLECTKS
jgi:hypothetical protein